MSIYGSAPSPAAQWRSVRRVYPIYTALAEKFGLGTPPFSDLEQFGSKVDAAAIPRIQKWLSEMDQIIEPHQFRHMLQTTGLANAEEKLDALVRRHLEKPNRGDADRDKLDFLLTQYLSVCAPPSFQARELSLDEVAQVLEPVLGECPTYVPQWLEPLESIVEQMRKCTDLDQLDALNILLRGRELKVSAGEKFFTTTALLVFTRFNYLVRHSFAKLLSVEAEAIRSGLQELEARGATTVDGSEAGFEPETSIDSVRELLNELTDSAAPAYSGEKPTKQLQIRLLRAAVEKTLEQYTSSLSQADQVRFARVELDVEELRRDLDEVRRECEELRSSLAAQAEMIAAQAELIDTLSRQVSQPLEPTPAPAPEIEQVTIEVPPTATPVAPEPVPPVTPPATPVAMTSTPPPAAPAPTAPVTENPAVPQHDAAAELSAKVTELVERVRKSVRAAGSRPTGVLTIGAGTVLLSEGEIAVLQSNGEPTDTVASTIEQAIGVRALLVDACEARKAGREVELEPLLQLARNVLQVLQRLGNSPDSRQGTIAGSARQLGNVMQQAEHAAPGVPRRV